MRNLLIAASLALSTACVEALPESRTLGDEEARRYVAATCGELDAGAGTCLRCAVDLLDALAREQLISGRQHDSLRAEFETGDGCPAVGVVPSEPGGGSFVECVPTTCAAAGRGCGTISDGCGGTLTCGASCSSRAWCLFRSEETMNDPLPPRTRPDNGPGFAKLAVSDEELPGCPPPPVNEDYTELNALLDPVREACSARFDALLALYCAASTPPPTVQAVVYWDPGCWSAWTHIGGIPWFPMSCQ